MDLDVLRTFATTRLEETGLAARGWTFRFDRARSRFGLCNFGTKTISVSRALVLLNDEAACRDTVLHEIAHALAGKRAGHGPSWKRICRTLGASPERCYDGQTVNRPRPPFEGVCPACDHRVPYYRLPGTARACGRCCRRYNEGRYDARYRLRIIRTQTGEEIPLADLSVKAVRRPGATWIGVCPACGARYPFPRRQRVPKACGVCCRDHAGGRFDERFVLQLVPAR